MDIEVIDLDDVYAIDQWDKQCGEVYLSREGNLLFLCTLCERKFKGYEAYANHITKTHCLPKEAEEDESVHSIIDIQLEYPYDEPESVIASQVDDEYSNLEHDFKLIDNIEFDAPVPNNCVEMEAFIATLQNTNENKLSIIQNDKKITKPEKQKTISSSISRRYRCPICSFVTKHYGVVMNHIARHLGDRRHFCEFCNKGFYTSSELRVHSRVHTGERPYLCTECGQTFLFNSSLYIHAKKCKNMRDEECSECGKKFFYKLALRNHMVVHSDQRSYQCTKCDASFKLLKVLRNHMKIHENKQEFKCQFCSSSFNQRASLSYHLKHKHFK